MHNALDPTHMNPAERLDELAGILAIGIIRHQSREVSADQRDSSLDFTAHQSVHVTDVKPIGETT